MRLVGMAQQQGRLLTIIDQSTSDGTESEESRLRW